MLNYLYLYLDVRFWLVYVVLFFLTEASLHDIF